MKFTYLFAVLALTVAPQTMAQDAKRESNVAIGENTFTIVQGADNTSVVLLRNSSFSFAFAKDLVDPNFVVSNATELGLSTERKTRLIDLIAEASAATTRAELATADTNGTVSQLLSQRPIDKSDALSAFDVMLSNEAALKRIRLELMVDATNMLSASEIAAYKLLRENK